MRKFGTSLKHLIFDIKIHLKYQNIMHGNCAINLIYLFFEHFERFYSSVEIYTGCSANQTFPSEVHIKEFLTYLWSLTFSLAFD